MSRDGVVEYALRLALAAAAAALAALPGAGCSPRQYAQQADRDAYGLIAQKQQVAVGQRSPFQIAYRPVLAVAAQVGPERGELNGRPIPFGGARPRVLNLEECLLIAARNSRSFQTRKEDLYVQALELANLRHDWSLVGGSLATNGDYHSGQGAGTGWDGQGAAELSFTQRFVTGGALTLAMGLDFATSFLNIRDTTFGSLIEANLTQPLLRGAWRGFAYEELYRAERDLAIAVLSYLRYTQEFAVDIASSYYQVLERRDQLATEQQSLSSFEQTYKFTKAQAEAGLLRRVQTDQAERRVLSARSRVELARRNYEDALDSFKLTLGLPVGASVEVDPAELGTLRPLPFPMGLDAAVRTALRARPDVLGSYAAVRDAERDVEIAADAFNPQLDAALGVAFRGREPRKPFQPRFHHAGYTLGLSLDYPLDQTDNRDNYRRALIDRERARRDLEEFLDTVRQDVRRSYRALEQSKRTYDIQQAAVKLGVASLRLAREELKAGLASTRDVLEAEDDLRSSRNALTAALVNYVTTRLRFLAALGMIAVDEQGRFHERDRPDYLDRYRGDAPAAP